VLEILLVLGVIRYRESEECEHLARLGQCYPYLITVGTIAVLMSTRYSPHPKPTAAQDGRGALLAYLMSPGTAIYGVWELAGGRASNLAFPGSAWERGLGVRFGS